jgi:hypothetical protein
MGKVSGGDKMLNTLDHIRVNLGKGVYLKVGFLNPEMATLALFNEFGVPSHNQPPRPFFRQMIDTKKGTWGKMYGALLVAFDYDGPRALKGMGEAIAGQLQHSINMFTTPPLAKSTIRAKGFEKPLINTGDMLRSVAFDVTKEND